MTRTQYGMVLLAAALVLVLVVGCAAPSRQSATPAPAKPSAVSPASPPASTPAPAKPAAKTPAPAQPSSPKPTSHPIVTLNWLTTPVGIGFYESAVGIASLLAKKHPWLRANAMETQGFGQNFLSLANESWRRKDTVAGGDVLTPSLAKKGIAPYTEERLKAYSPKLLWAEDWSMNFVMTLDPNIKTFNDLKGKRVVTGPKAGNFAQSTLLVAKYAGIHDDIKWQHLTFTAFADAVNDNLADAFFGYVDWNPVTSKEYKEAVMVSQAKASGKKYRIVPMPGDVLNAMVKDGINLPRFELPKNPMTGEPTPVTVSGQLLATTVAEEFPDELAYELTKFMLTNIDDVRALGGRSATWSREGMVAEVASYLHPGATRAFKEAGLLK